MNQWARLCLLWYAVLCCCAVRWQFVLLDGFSLSVSLSASLSVSLSASLSAVVKCAKGCSIKPDGVLA